MAAPANVNRNVISQLHRSNTRNLVHLRLPQSPQHRTRRNRHHLPPAPVQVSHKLPARSRRIAPTVIAAASPTAAMKTSALTSWELLRSKSRVTIRATNISARKTRISQARSGSAGTKSLQKRSPPSAA